MDQSIRDVPILQLGISLLVYVMKIQTSMINGSRAVVLPWLFPSLPTPVATTIASVFWVLSLIGFVAAALSFWGILVPGDAWRQLAVVSAIVSILGIALFFGTWPMFNTMAALAVNIAVLVTQLWLHWPPQAMFGK